MTFEVLAPHGVSCSRSQELEKRVIALKSSGLGNMLPSVHELVALSDFRQSSSGTPLGAVEELARKLLGEMDGNADAPTASSEEAQDDEEVAAQALQSQIAARFPKGAAPEQVWSGLTLVLCPPGTRCCIE